MRCVKSKRNSIFLKQLFFLVYKMVAALGIEKSNYFDTVFALSALGFVDGIKVKLTKGALES